MAKACAPVAQLERAPDYEYGGREFESLRARHFRFVRIPQDGTKSVAPLTISRMVGFRNRNSCCRNPGRADRRRRCPRTLGRAA